MRCACRSSASSRPMSRRSPAIPTITCAAPPRRRRRLGRRRAVRLAAASSTGDTWVEIEVRGDFIVDCNGQPVDANAVGRRSAPTGNGTPGGTFLSTFRVEPRPPSACAATLRHRRKRKGASS